MAIAVHWLIVQKLISQYAQNITHSFAFYALRTYFNNADKKEARNEGTDNISLCSVFVCSFFKSRASFRRETRKSYDLMKSNAIASYV